MGRLAKLLGGLVLGGAVAIVVILSIGAEVVHPTVVPDSPRPVATWQSVSSVVFSAHPQQASTLGNYTLQDGVLRKAAFPLTWTATLGAVDGGYDVTTDAGATPLASTWYFVYLVPSTADSSRLTPRASTSAPPTGPTGYTNKWRYVGAVYSDASSQIRRFSSNADRVLWVPALSLTVGSATDATPVSLSLSDNLPSTAISVIMRAECRSTDVAQRIDVWGNAVTASLSDGGVMQWLGDGGIILSPLAADSTHAAQSDSDSAEVPTSTATVYYQRVGNTDGGLNVLTILGYRDGY